MSTVLYKADGVTPCRFAHTWSDFYKGIDEQGPYYTCTFLFDDWADSDTIPNQMLGKVTLTGGVGGTITRVVPFQHPLSPNLYCKEARVKGIGKPVLNASGYPVYAQGFTVDCTFRSWIAEGLMNAGDDPFGQEQIDPSTPLLWCTQELDYETEVITVPNNQALWKSTGNKAQIPLAIPVGITIMRLTFHRVPYMPMGLINSAIGLTNSDTFLQNAPGYVLFPGAPTSREASADGSINQRVTMIFKARTIPWASSINPTTLNPDGLLKPDGVTPIVGSTAFNPLLVL